MSNTRAGPRGNPVSTVARSMESPAGQWSLGRPPMIGLAPGDRSLMLFGQAIGRRRAKQCPLMKNGPKLKEGRGLGEELALEAMAAVEGEAGVTRSRAGLLVKGRQ